MEFRAPQPTGGGNNAALLLQLATSASSQAAQTISGIGAQLLQLSEARKDRELTRERDQAQRDFTVGRDVAQEAAMDRRQAASNAFTVARDNENRAFQLLLEEKQHELGMQDMERQAELRAQAELEQSRMEQERVNVQNQRISDIVRLAPGLVARTEAPLYSFSPRFNKVGAGPDAQSRIAAQLRAEGYGEAVANDMALAISQPFALEWVDGSQFATVYGALQTSGDDNPARTLDSILKDIPRSQLDASRRAAEHVDKILGSRIDALTRQATGALEIPGSQPGRSTPQPLSVIFDAGNVTPRTLGESAHSMWVEANGDVSWDAALLPEWRHSNWILDGGVVRPRAGLDKITIERMQPGTKPAQFYTLAAQSLPAAAYELQGSTSIPLTPSRIGSGAGPAVTPGTPAGVGDGMTVEQFQQGAVEGILNMGSLREMFGNPIAPNY